jgi:hypothetical protein
MFPGFEFLINTLVKAFFAASTKGRIVIGLGLFLCFVCIFLFVAASDPINFPLFLSHVIATRVIAAFVGITGASLLAYLIVRQELRDQQEGNEKIEAAEARLRKNPEEPQLAWDVAREKLERYLDRNLTQVRQIFGLTVFVMLVGFALIGYGTYQAFHDLEHFSASVLSAVSGVVVSFIGGTFLALYKSTMAQASDYVTILERINAVGMSVQILKSLDEDPVLKREATAEIAKQLLRMYSSGASKGKRPKSV